MMKVFHLKRAIADQLREADFWYDQSFELKNEYIREFENAIETIKKAPTGYVRSPKQGNCAVFTRNVLIPQSSINTLSRRIY